MIQSLADSPEALIAGLGVVVLGYLIKYREWTFLIAGYDATSDVPDAVAADIVGNLAIRIGIATMGFGALAAVTSIPTAVAFGFLAIVVVAAARAIYRMQTYQPAVA